VTAASRVLICGTNWLGDSVMSMPAVRAFLKASPGASVTILARAPVAGLWRLFPGLAGVEVLEPGLGGTVSAGWKLRGRFDECRVFPNSFRSALIPCVAGIPERRGFVGHWRSALLTHVVSADLPPDAHQSLEYARLMDVPDGALMPPPYIEPDADAGAWAGDRLCDDGACWVAVLPGAARGPSKQWPASHFAQVVRRLSGEAGCRVVLLGGHGDRDACARVLTESGGSALDLAGRTTIPQLAAVLSRCRCAVTNDSGGMHLAAAAGTRVVAVYGLTDPRRTGPLGAGHRVIARDDVPHARDIAARSAWAEKVLASIEPAAVFEAAQAVMGAE